MPIPTSPLGMLIWWSVLGLLVGSFLNVCIYRLPLEGQSVGNPRRSRCPKCARDLHWYENIPILSWLIQLGRCRGCQTWISIRYPLVEILTAGLFGLSAVAGAPGNALVAVRALVLSGLIVATFVDFDYFEIPDEVSIGGMLLAPLLSLLVPELHAGSPIALLASEGGLEVSRFGAFTASLAGLAVGGGVLWIIGWLGSRAYGTEAMGFGDVKLLAAGGGFVGPGGALAALMVAAALASVAGLANMLRFYWLVRSRAHSRGRRVSIGYSIKIARIAGRYLPFGPYLALGIGIVLLYWNHVTSAFT